MSDLDRARERFAQEVRGLANVRNEALVRAFATVPREAYLGPGPWRVVGGARHYVTTKDANPERIYANVLVAIDEKRRLNNGEPAGLARWFDQLDLAPGERVLHVGCGVGYYTAILAETVGPEGRVTGVELDPELAERARANLAHYGHVDVVAGDGGSFAAGPRDAIFVNAGATEPRRAWLDALVPNGRLALPMTVAADDSGMGGGWILHVVRREGAFEAGFTTPVGIFPCIGSRDDSANERLRVALRGGGQTEVRRLRLDPHEPGPECWLHGPEICLSR